MTNNPPLCPIPPAAWRRAFNAPPEVGHQVKHPGQFDGGSRHGVPLGGLGTGGINRAWRGEFRRWTLKPGALKHFVEAANNFAVFQQVEGAAPEATLLAPRPDDAESGSLSAWGWPAAPLPGEYAGLFPKAWYNYPATGPRPVEMVCEQFSPVLPHRYAEAALPVAVFRWHLRNTGDKPATVGLMFSWANMNGWFDDYSRDKAYSRSGGNFNAPLDTPLSRGVARGVIFDCRRASSVPPENRGQWAIAAPASERVVVNRTVTFDAVGRGADIWQQFAQTGAVPARDESWLASPVFSQMPDQTLAGALSATVTLAPGECIIIPMTLVWDLPVVQFGLGRRHYRRYTRDLGLDGRNAAQLAALALENAARWAAAIDAWHADHAARYGFGPEIDRMLFNELYLLVDGWTAWTDRPVEPDDPAPPFFGIIECPDYPCYNTFDLWVYGSFALLANFPDLERLVIRAYAEAVLQDDPTRRRVTRSGALFPAVQPGAVPHDLGGPHEDPGLLLNAYVYQNPNIWKDLPAQFVLTVARDVLALDDDDLLHTCWPAVVAALNRLAQFDRDGDGLLEHNGLPDQTYDNIPLHGPSAYCGGLYLAALAAGVTLAERLDQPQQAEAWQRVLAKGQTAFQTKLWNGSYYRLDTDNAYREAVFIEQLFGPWYAKLLGRDDLIPPPRARQALQAIYHHNFAAIGGGQLGAVNITGGGQAILDSIAAHGNPAHQTSEVLTGINYAFAAQLKSYGLADESMQVLQAVHRAIYQERGLWFRTPAAYDPEANTFRAIMNLRPLVIWALVYENSANFSQEASKQL